MRVLVVEDDKQLAAALRRGLEDEGYAVDTALDGAEGEWLAGENSYDALVLDIMLPTLRGDELCARTGQGQQQCACFIDGNAEIFDLVQGQVAARGEPGCDRPQNGDKCAARGNTKFDGAARVGS